MPQATPPANVPPTPERIAATLRKHWHKPNRADNPAPVPADQVEKVSKAALDCMLTRQFRVGPLPAQPIYDQFLDRVRRRVSNNLPIYVTVGYAPIKNLNAVSYSRADWAEFFSLGHLVAWANKVQAVYAPGLQFRIVYDDTTLAMANKSDWSQMKAYQASIAELIKTLGYESLFLPSFGHSAFAWLFHFGLYQIARFRVWRWEKRPENQEQIDKMLQYARRNVVLPPGLEPEKHEAYFRAASHRYRVYWDALQLSGVTKSKNRILAMYLNGAQHHLPETVALHLTSVDKGQVTQPWQGEGALLDNGHGKLEPFVLTAGRRQRHHVEMIEGLSLLSLPSFERIAVVRAMETPAGEVTNSKSTDQALEKQVQ